MQKIRERANFAGALFGHLLAFSDSPQSFGVEVSYGSFDVTDIHVNSRQLLRRGIVKLAGDAAAFFVLQGHEAPGDFAQLVLGVLESGNVLADHHQAGAAFQFDRFG